MIMKKFRQLLRDMKVRYKIMLIYFCIGFFPLLFLGIFAYGQISNLVIDQEQSASKTAITQAMSSLDNDIKIYDNLSDYLSFNDTVANVVSSSYSSQYKLYDQVTTSLDPMISSVQYFHTDVKQLTIYSRNDIIAHGTTLAPITDIQKESWYQAAKKSNTPLWFVNKANKEVISVRNMPAIDRKGKLAILYLRIDYDQMFKSFDSITNKNYGIFVVDKNDHVVYEKQKFDAEYESRKLSYKEFKSVRSSKEYNIVKESSTATGWKVYYYQSSSLASSSIKKTGLFVSLIVGLCIIAAAIALFATSKFLVGRIEKLQENVKSVEEGNLEVYVKSNDKDEIGQLINGFDSMIERIKFLIEEVYESKIMQKNYEMRALQQQINPHFLYNTLSMINFMAIESGQDQISKITLALSDFYRTSLNKGKNTCSLADEVKNMNAYLDIQMMMHDYEFDLDIQIDDEIMECESLNLILQPIVENAILHGIDLLEDRKGLIKVYATTNEDTVFVMVEDNGVGMDQETIEKMLSQNSKGYGVRNVNERIKLIYGEQYGLHVESVVGQGTVVTIKLPKKKFVKNTMVIESQEH